jgi:hypothetical protein
MDDEDHVEIIENEMEGSVGWDGWIDRRTADVTTRNSAIKRRIAPDLSRSSVIAVGATAPACASKIGRNRDVVQPEREIMAGPTAVASIHGTKYQNCDL